MASGGKFSFLFEVRGSLASLEALGREVRATLVGQFPELLPRTLDRVEAELAAAVAETSAGTMPLQVEVHVEAGRIQTRAHRAGTGFSVCPSDLMGPAGARSTGWGQILPVAATA